MRRNSPVACGLSAAVLCGLLAVTPTPGQAQHEHPQAQVLAPGYSPLEFEPPTPGSYTLPPLGQAGDGEVITSDGKAVRLHELLGDKLVVLSFIYTRCSDVNGCPLATYVLSGLQQRLRDDPVLNGRVRLVSVSFDPDHDTPAVLERYSKPFRKQGFDWQFVTSGSAAQLAPILDSYNQWIVRDYDQQGRYLGTISHLLRVFLIDRERRIRNIYSVSFLHADTVANDLHTVNLETVHRGRSGQ